MPDFSCFDTRGYRSVSAREGYDLWSSTYERTIKPEMDEWLLDQIRSVHWSSVDRAADLGSGTGRTGQWLKAHGVRRIDGVDLSSEMLARARARGVFETLHVADVSDSRLDGGAYDLVTTCLVDEHLKDLRPLYREAARLARSGATYVLVGFHPFFIMRTGMPTHFDAPDGKPLAIETHVHLLSEHVAAALEAGWQMQEMHEQVIDDRWIARKESWRVHKNVPVSFAFVWKRV